MASVKGLNFKVAATVAGLSSLTSFQRSVLGISKSFRDAVDGAQGLGREMKSAADSASAFVPLLDNIDRMNLKFRQSVNELTGVSREMKSAADSASVFDSEFASLQAKFNPAAAEIRRVEQTMAELTRAQRMGAVSAEQYEQAMIGLQGEMKRLTLAHNSIIPANGRWNRGLSDSRRAIQQAGFQVNDFFLQVAGGQNIILAFSQQMGQLIQFFGTWGSVVGAAIAIGGALYLMFGDVKTAVEKLNTANDELTKSLSSLSSIGTASLADLREEYGRVDQTLLDLLKHQREYDLLMVNNAATAALGAAYDEFSGSLGRINDQFRTGATSMAALRFQLGFSSQEVHDFARAFDAAMAAVTIEDKAAAFAEIEGFLARSKLAGSEFVNEFRKATFSMLKIADAAEDASVTIASTVGAASGLSGWAQMANANMQEAAQAADDLANTNMAGAIQAAAGWAKTLWDRMAGAVSAAQAVANLQNRRLMDLNAGAFGRAGAPGQGIARDYSLDAWNALLPKDTGGGGGGGESPLVELQRGYADLAKTIDPAVTSTRAFADANRAMMDAFATGNLENIQAMFDKVKPLISDMQKSFEELTKTISDSMMTSFLAVVKRTETLADGVKSVLNSIIDKTIQMLMSPVFDGIAGFLSKSIFGFVGSLPALPSMDGGGYTGDASRSGGVDGKGGFLSIMHPKETVTDHTRGGDRNGGVVINVTVNGATGNSEIMEMVNRGVSTGLQYYDAKVLPSSVKRVSMNPRRVG
jgi:hypothetical protein